MPRFFIKPGGMQGDTAVLLAEDAAHIARVLRMEPGDRLTVCDARGVDFECEIISASPERVKAHIVSSRPSESEPDVFASLFLALPKGDKMDFVVQKATELGVGCIVPMVSARCVSRPDGKTLVKKTARWQKIAEEAAKQCGRGRIPEVAPAVSFEQAVETASLAQMPLFLYEGERARSLHEALSLRPFKTASLMIGPEGGFEEKEVQYAVRCGLMSVSIGKRILRCETAPIAGLAALMYHSGNL